MNKKKIIMQPAMIFFFHPKCLMSLYNFEFTSGPEEIWCRTCELSIEYAKDLFFMWI